MMLDQRYTENINDGIEWIEDAISKKHIKHYDYKEFNNVQEIGSGGFGKVYRANWKSSKKYFALKSFELNSTTANEVVREIKLQRDVDFHDNIIRFLGITIKVESGDNLKYLLVMEYADGGSLRNYLKNKFKFLTWNDKYRLAYQLACAVSCLHEEGMVHRDLHSGNVLIHQNKIKLADFGLSKRIEEASKMKANIFGIVPYVDPIRYGKRKNSTHPKEIYLINSMSDVYSVGVLLWEISSGKPPFYIEGEQYDFSLALEISKGLRESPIPGTPEDYIKIYTECWDSEPNKRPPINQVVAKLEAIKNKFDIPDLNYSLNLNEIQNISVASLDSLHGILTRVIENFSELDTNEVIGSLASSTSSKQYVSSSSSPFLSSQITSSPLSTEQISPLSPFLSSQITSSPLSTEQISPLSPSILTSLSIKRLVEYIFKIINEGKEIKQLVLDYLRDNDIDQQETYHWLRTQNDSDSVFLLGYFKFEIRKINYKKAFKSFLDSSKKNHVLAQYYVGKCYQFGYGTRKDEKLAFDYFKMLAFNNYAIGQFEVGCIYEKGKLIKKNFKTAIEWYEKAAKNGNNKALYNLAIIYMEGKGVEKNGKKSFELFTELTDKEDYQEYRGWLMLEHCYTCGIGANIDREKANEAHKIAVKLGYRSTYMDGLIIR